MDFRVELTERAQRDIAILFDWLQREQAGEAGARWFNGLRAAIDSLATLPGRYPIAPESRRSPVEIRQLLYGRPSHVYRILFSVEQQVVHVLHIRHGRRRPPIWREIGPTTGR
jgi:plasmid stabilization system protein ParE